jgi:inhibitor of cysteine peptidase
VTTISLDSAAGGRTLRLAPGDRLELRLEENRSTGFRWRVEENESRVLVLERDAYSAARDGVAGGGGVRDLRFLVAEPGRSVLRLAKRRSWDGDRPPAATFEITVEAK